MSGEQGGRVLFNSCDRGPVCGCLRRLHVQLADVNGTPGKTRRSGAAILFINRVDRKGPVPPIVAASFCPLCGEAYE